MRGGIHDQISNRNYSIKTVLTKKLVVVFTYEYLSLYSNARSTIER
jgi:hypothetical protein